MLVIFSKHLVCFDLMLMLKSKLNSLFVADGSTGCQIEQPTVCHTFTIHIHHSCFILRSSRYINMMRTTITGDINLIYLS